MNLSGWKSWAIGGIQGFLLMIIFQKLGFEGLTLWIIFLVTLVVLVLFEGYIGLFDKEDK